MNSSQVPRGSSMPLVIFIVFLIAVIIGLVVYFLMFHKPSMEKCSNLYQSNICTKTYCTTTFPGPSMEWKPKLAAGDGFLQVDLDHDTTSAVGGIYKTGLSDVSIEFDSNVCTFLNTKDMKAYHPLATGSTTNLDATKVLCSNVLTDLDKDLTTYSSDFFVRGKLLDLRNEVLDACRTNPSTDTSPPTQQAISDATTIPATHFKKDGQISNVFCKPKTYLV